MHVLPCAPPNPREVCEAKGVHGFWKDTSQGSGELRGDEGEEGSAAHSMRGQDIANPGRNFPSQISRGMHSTEEAPHNGGESARNDPPVMAPVRCPFVVGCIKVFALVVAQESWDVALHGVLDGFRAFCEMIADRAGEAIEERVFEEEFAPVSPITVDDVGDADAFLTGNRVGSPLPRLLSLAVEEEEQAVCCC